MHTYISYIINKSPGYVNKELPFFRSNTTKYGGIKKFLTICPAPVKPLLPDKGLHGSRHQSLYGFSFPDPFPDLRRGKVHFPAMDQADIATAVGKIPLQGPDLLQKGLTPLLLIRTLRPFCTEDHPVTEEDLRVIPVPEL